MCVRGWCVHGDETGVEGGEGRPGRLLCVHVRSFVGVSSLRVCVAWRVRI